MEDSIDPALAQQAQDAAGIADIAHDEFGADDRVGEARAQVVQNDDSLASFHELENYVASDVPGAAGHEYAALHEQEGIPC
ncbi:hypothetical protein GLA29479_598 [Lysobacter antibioticus]|nr:hypothetical protein GLA29479_598 [Lysobacter antibioticus]